jgi:hypothetical protein
MKFFIKKIFLIFFAAGLVLFTLSCFRLEGEDDTTAPTITVTSPGGWVVENCSFEIPASLLPVGGASVTTTASASDKNSITDFTLNYYDQSSLSGVIPEPLGTVIGSGGNVTHTFNTTGNYLVLIAAKDEYNNESCIMGLVVIP